MRAVALSVLTLLACRGKAEEDTQDEFEDTDVFGDSDTDTDADTDTDSDSDSDTDTDTDVDADTDADVDVDVDVDADTDSDTDPDDCWGRAPEECLEYPDCQVIDARLVTSDSSGRYCVDYTAPLYTVGCMPSEMGCTGVITWAAPPDDPTACYLFGSGCTPEGWTGCTDPDMETDEGC